ncbi:proline-rich transmembrane protein 1-like [Argopecten irradians]|uniref:proline-rich transmembrane protein 1-like n=1 Tax=Argopecten irradians TaxID=31199 RepID=UPI003720537E
MDQKSGNAPPPYTNQGYTPGPPSGNTGYPQSPGYAPPQGYGQPPVGNQTWGQPQYQQQQMVTNNVIVTQAGGMQPVIMAPPPEDNMVRAIIATFFCFWPIGMFAIWKAMESKSAYNRGDMAMAHANANSARQLANVAIGFGTGVIIAVIIYIVVLYSVML